MELADVLDSKSSGSDTVRVRPPPPAPKLDTNFDTTYHDGCPFYILWEFIMINIESHIYQLIDLLCNCFGTILLCVGLQGGYLRREATCNSDIDINMIFNFGNKWIGLVSCDMI